MFTKSLCDKPIDFCYTMNKAALIEEKNKKVKQIEKDLFKNTITTIK
jgi:hypothetical protein